MQEYVKTRQVPQLPHFKHLFEFECRSVGELVSRKLRQRGTPIRIVLDDYSTWIRQIGTVESVKWMISKHNLPICVTKDLLWILLSSLSLCLKNVEVTLVDGKLSDPMHTLLKLKPFGWRFVSLLGLRLTDKFNLHLI